MVTVDVAQVSVGLDHVAHAALQFLRLREAAVDCAVPEHAVLGRGDPGGSSGGYGASRKLGIVVVAAVGGRHGREDLDDEGPARRGLQGHLAQARREGREELLGILRLMIGSRSVRREKRQVRGGWADHGESRKV